MRIFNEPVVFNKEVHFKNRFRIRRHVITGDATILTNQSFVACKHSAALSLTLDSFHLQDGDVIYVKDESLTAMTNNITITPNNGALIEGQDCFVINRNGMGLEFYTDGTNWFVK